MKRLLTRIICLIRGHKHHRIGKCDFYGDAGFIDKCKVAMNKIKANDPNLLETINSTHWIVVQNGTKPFYNIANFLCAISDDWLLPAWNEWGVIVSLIYAQFFCNTESHFSGKDSQSECDTGACLKLTEQWCETHGCPEDIILHLSFLTNLK